MKYSRNQSLFRIGAIAIVATLAGGCSLWDSSFRAEASHSMKLLELDSVAPNEDARAALVKTYSYDGVQTVGRSRASWILFPWLRLPALIEMPSLQDAIVDAAGTSDAYLMDVRAYYYRASYFLFGRHQIIVEAVRVGSKGREEGDDS